MKGDGYMKKNFFIPVNEDFHQAIKEYCIKNKISISKLVIKLLTKELYKWQK
jgi:hypothetical protein